MNTERDVDDLIEDLRHNSPLSVLSGIVLATLLLAATVNLLTGAPVSYTHLTLPTIYSV